MSDTTANKGLDILNKLYNYSINGLPTSKSADVLANEYLERYGNNNKIASKMFVKVQIKKCTTTGFLTGLGGLITLPVTIPADISSSLYVQMRMIAAIAVMGGYELNDDMVRTWVYSILLKVELANVLKEIGVQVADKVAINSLKKVPGKIFIAINKKLGFRFITKFGEKRIINLGKAIPLVGGVVNGGFNNLETRAIARRAINEFIINPISTKIDTEVE